MDSNPRYHIAVVAPSAPPLGAGGVASAHFNIYRALQQAGCETSLLTFNELGRNFNNTPEIVRCGASRQLRTLLGLGVYCYLKGKGSKKTAYHVADIVNSVPGVLQMNRSLGHLCPDLTIIPDHGAPGLFLRKLKGPVILVAHHNPARFADNPLFGEFCPIDAAQAVTLEQRVLTRVEAVICPSAYMKRVFLETYRFSGEISVIPNVVDVAFIDSIPVHDIRTELKVPKDTPVIYIPSAGSVFKGSRFVFEITRRLAKHYQGPLAFYLSGQIDPTLRAELAHVPSNAQLYMPGLLSNQANIALIKSCSFGISPTLIENFSMAMLEAGFCGLPIVTFSVGGNEELILEGESGFLVPFLDVEALIEKSRKLLDKEFCAEMRKMTELSLRNRFDSRTIALRYVKFCERYLRTLAK